MPYFVLCEDSPMWRTTRLPFIPSSIAICAFPAVPVNIWFKIRSTNESRLFSGSWQSVDKWIEPTCALEIITFYLVSILSFFFYFALFFFYFGLLFYYYFFTLDFFWYARAYRSHRQLRPCMHFFDIPIEPPMQPGSILIVFWSVDH